MHKALIGAVAASGLIVPAQAKLWTPPAPAIIRSDADHKPFKAMLPGFCIPMVASAATVPVTWNPLDQSENVTLSNLNMTMTGEVGGSAGARATVGNSTGKWYAEFIHSSPDDNVSIGIATASWNLNSNPWLDTTSFVYVPQLGYIFNSGLVDSTDLTADGTRIMMALDVPNLKIWFGSAGTWFDSGDPAANSGGYTIPSGTWFPMASVAETGDYVTAYFSTASQSHGAPSGFSPWG